MIKYKLSSDAERQKLFEQQECFDLSFSAFYQQGVKSIAGNKKYRICNRRQHHHDNDGFISGWGFMSVEYSTQHEPLLRMRCHLKSHCVDLYQSAHSRTVQKYSEGRCKYYEGFYSFIRGILKTENIER